MLKKLVSIFKKKKTKEFDFFEFVRLFNHLTHQKDKIYINPTGEKFILTKYGFYPVEQFNLNLIIEELIKEINDLKLKVKNFENQKNLLKSKNYISLEKYNKLKDSFEKLFVSRNEKINNAQLPFLKKHEKLKLLLQDLLSKRNEKNIIIKSLKKEISELKNNKKIYQKNTENDLKEKYDKLNLLLNNLIKTRHDKNLKIKELKEKNLKLTNNEISFKKNPILENKNIIFLNNKIKELYTLTQKQENELNRLHADVNRKRDIIDTQSKIIDQLKTKLYD